MTILQSLAGYYDRMAARHEAEPPGFSRVAVSFAVVIDRTGCPVNVRDLRVPSGKRLVPPAIDVPASKSRTVKIVPNFLWDKSAYSLGVTATGSKRTAEEHASFREFNASALAGATDEGLAALVAFLGRWTPASFAEHDFFVPEMLDANIVFELDGDVDENSKQRFIYQRPAALSLIEAQGGDGQVGLCLVTGLEAPLARLHRPIKGVDGAQMAGAALVSFNADSYESWGRKQGENAPTSEAAAFKYTAALNRLLDRGGPNRMQLVAGAHLDPSRRRPFEVRRRQRFRLGDATVAFWADAAGRGEEVAATAEVMAGMFMAEADPLEPGTDATLTEDATVAATLRAQLTSLSEGRPAEIGTVEVPPEVRINILGLAPNAARLSVRFWMQQDLSSLARHARAHRDDCRIEPLPRRWGTVPSLNRLLLHTVAAQEKWENIPPLLAGEVARAVLGGTAYPRTWLSNAIMRLRAGDDPATGWHAAAIRAVLAREQRLRRKDPNVPELGETAMSLDPEHRNVGYQLGRMFAVYELAQRAALGTKLNRTIRDSYFGSAMATPATVFSTIISNGQNHLGKVRRDKPGWAVLIERELEQISAQLTPRQPSTIPKTLRLEDQGEFAIGYYHQRRTKLGKGSEQELDFEKEITTLDEDAQ